MEERSGKSDLNDLLNNLEPELHPDEFVYCSVARGAALVPGVDPIGSFQESKGTTLIVRRAEAEGTGLPFAFPCRMITLRVHSSLHAIGLIARIAGELAAHDISANCVSAFYHDHLLVPSHQGEEALRLLRELQRRSLRQERMEAAGAPQIREMKIADYDPVYALLRSTEGVLLRAADSREAVQRYLERNPGLSFVACAEDRIVGCVMAGHDGRRGYLNHLAVEPAARQQGIGTALANEALAALKRAGIQKVHLAVVLENARAHEFWAHRGWVRRNDIVWYSWTNAADPNA